ncbi:MAG: hotdog fold thioesterase [Bacteriovoracaceae bacterium]|nr:hotdog fold thioesterase [Bacteriovoracaceae bacterium]
MKIRVIDINEMKAPPTLLDSLGIKITRITEDFIEGTMPVDGRTHQPYGLLHGGASVALAETLGSIGANLCVDPKTHYCVGLDINANHISGVRSGLVTGVAKPIHVGRSTQVWDIRITSAEGKLVCVSRLTMAVVAIKA